MIRNVCGTQVHNHHLTDDIGGGETQDTEGASHRMEGTVPRVYVSQRVKVV